MTARRFGEVVGAVMVRVATVGLVAVILWLATLLLGIRLPWLPQ